MSRPATKRDSRNTMADSGKEEFNLDGILSELGSFGKYQLFLLFLLAFRDSFLSMCNFNYVFTAAEVNFRCRIPECDGNSTVYDTPWAVSAVSNASVCERPSSSGNISTVCTAGMFLNDRVACTDLIYENYNSIVAEFNLGCHPWKQTLIGTVHNLGLVFSYVVSGFISDRYGRKVVIVGTPLMVAIAGLLKSFATNYWTLIVLEFLETSLGYGNASMVLSLETVSQKSRVAFSCISDILSCFGGAFFGLIAWKIPYWRHMMWAIYAPLLIVVFYIFLLDEGVRWLFAHNRKEEAVRILNKVAKINNITLSNTTKDMLAKVTEDKAKADEVRTEQAGPTYETETASILSALRSKKMILRIALIAACSFCCMFVYNGAIINSTNISGSKYLNYSIMQLVAIPTRVIIAFTLTRFGRKAPICVAYCFCAIFFIASAFVPKSIWWSSILFYLVGKMCSSYGIFSFSVVAMEVFPTTSRNSLTNVSNTVGRLGSVLAPQTPLLSKYMAGLPSIVFGVVALGPAGLALLLPDTSRCPLPDRIEEAEKIDETTDNVTESNRVTSVETA